ncbi:MAG: hypothetical protein AAFZ18_23390 [Myxococcota bacterium]
MLALLALAVALPDPAVDETERVWLFEPAVEIGVLVHLDDAVDEGLLVRSSLDVRWKRLRSAFFRLSYDTSTARMLRENVEGVSRLEADLGLQDITLGGGWRLGPDALQVVGSIQLGIQLADLPVLRQGPNQSFTVEAETSVAGISLVALGLEYYIFPDLALTTEFTGRLRFVELDGRSPVAFGFTLGVTTAI